jgi:two-component system chemotaxis response regulator CheY
MRVLVVDDLGSARKILRKLLEEIGSFDIDEAADGAQALKKLQTEQFDLVISDWEMPKMKGIELLEALRQDSKFTQLPFIMITANRTREGVIKASNSGVSDYISKPFDSATLKRKIDAVLGHKQKMKS